MFACHFWLEQGRVRWWTRDATGLLPADTPLARPQETGWALLRDGLWQAALEQTLRPELADVLEALLAQHPCLALRLADDLPETWQHCPFEWLRHRGDSLRGRVFVERFAPRRCPSAACLDSSAVAVLDLWPDTEKVAVCADLAEWPDVDVYAGVALAEDFLRHGDLSGLSLLAVASHGTEQEHAPFRLGNGGAWSLPTENGMPPVVLLAACGNEQGNLIGYGKRLLEAGARAVVAPVGKLEAGQAGGFLRDFLDAWAAGTRLDRLMADQQARPGGTLAAQRFCLLGHGGLRVGSPCRADELPDDRLAAAARRELREASQGGALLALIERITLRSYREAGALDSAEALFRDSLGIVSGDAGLEALLLGRLDALADELSALGKAWIVPWLGALSEAHGHALLGRYERLASKHRTLLSEAAPTEAYHHLSKIPYRQGNYPAAARTIRDGFGRLAPGLTDKPRLRLLGQLTNLLIDLDLPEAAATACDSLRQGLNPYQGEDAGRQRLNLLDREARLAVWNGKVALAMEKLLEKRWRSREWAADMDVPESGHRELAGLLHLAAWHAPASAEAGEYAEEVKQALRDPGQVISKTRLGNSDGPYLLRALGLWCWRGDDAEAARLLLGYADFIQCLLDSRHDAGPPGFALWYLHRHFIGKQLPAGLSGLEKALSRLDSDNYWLEMAAVFALLADRENAGECLSRFQAMRRQALEPLGRLPEDLGVEHWRSAAERRSAAEALLLLDTPGLDPARLADGGLLPL